MKKANFILGIALVAALVAAFLTLPINHWLLRLVGWVRAAT